MKKILLIGPYKNAELRIGQYLAPPLGIYRIKSYIEKKTDCIVDIIDIDLKGDGYFTAALKNNNYDIIGFSLLQPTLKNDIFIISQAKELSPDSLLISGGQGAVFNHELILKQTPVDVIVKGFGEFALLDIINSFSQLQKVKGLYLKDHNRNIIDTGEIEPYTYEQFREISLSFYFNKVPYEEYWEFMEKIYTKKHLKIMKNEDLLYTIRIITSSHCPKKCVFCSSTNFFDVCTKNQQRVALNPEDIYILVKNALKSHPGCKAIYFNDDDFLFDKERIKKLCLLLQNIRGLSYFCLSRVDSTDEDLLRLMGKTGFKFIIYGVESFSNRILKDMNKNISVGNPREFSKKVIKETISAGITPLMNIILFYPTTTIKDIVETIETTIELVSCGARLTVYPYIEVYPGSDILKHGYPNFLYDTFSVNEQGFRLPQFITASSNKIRTLASESVRLTEELLDGILRKHNWTGVIPHPLYGLTLFLAVYKMLGLDTYKIENLIDKILVNEQRQNILSNKPEVKAMC